MQSTRRTSFSSAVICTPSATDEKNGFCRSGTIKPTADTPCCLRLRALLLGLYDSSWMRFKTLCRVLSATVGLRLMTALTVPTDTPARVATSRMVVGRFMEGTSYRPCSLGYCRIHRRGRRGKASAKTGRRRHLGAPRCRKILSNDSQQKRADSDCREKKHGAIHARGIHLRIG